MCGILGSINNIITFEHLELIKHRGPDDFEIKEIQSSIHKIFLAHRRLSIVDLSPAGHQPMFTDCGKYAIVFNGEIYNHDVIRNTLKQENYRGHSDTETILYALKENGITAAEKFNGIFAFAFLDLEKQKLFIARDFFGVKPLFYSFSGKDFVFSSELRPIESILKNNNPIDINSLSTLLRLRYIPSPYTLYEKIQKVRPGHYIEINLLSEKINPIEKSFNFQTSNTFSGNFKDAVNLYNEYFSAAVKRQLMSDVEIGIMLSGGVDSAMVAAIAAKNSSYKLKAFTVGFDGNHSSDEIKEAQQSAKLLNLDHYIVQLNRNDFHDMFAKCVKITEEPSASTSIIPFYYLSKLASKHVKVVLTGQGADEPLGGYFRYKEELLKEVVPSFALNAICSTLNSPSIKNEKIKRALNTLPINNDIIRFDEAYSLFSFNQIESLIGQSNNRSLDSIHYNYELYNLKEIKNSASRMMKLDARMNLADDLLNYTDKISMYFGIETRVPLLDTELVSFIESLPLSYKVNLFKTKIIHKKYAENLLPKQIINRKKNGFQSPTNEWFRTDIANIFDLLTQSNSRFLSLFEKSAIIKLLDLHKKGYNMEKQLFLLMSIYYWLEKNN